MAEQENNERGGPLGGHELPPDVQDRPEQNRGYDAAVEGRKSAPVEAGDGEPARDQAEDGRDKP